eukprot:CAMPEP_0177607738 /NCGR_PEP_ID=MMETSP0419_2-20121207/18082_1 /TAXON_ID=582737 /ORGANISM="Tetraselmis sp., Strain GSL018" /LENGTH=123 /DNA_ID=CAMNT_0019102349 /DNA_START=1070 /DNA_END=1438 /DNA_ORIENTATION=+
MGCVLLRRYEELDLVWLPGPIHASLPLPHIACILLSGQQVMEHGVVICLSVGAQPEADREGSVDAAHWDWIKHRLAPVGGPALKDSPHRVIVNKLRVSAKPQTVLLLGWPGQESSVHAKPGHW